MLKRIFDRKNVVRSLAIRARALEISRSETISLFDAKRVAEQEIFQMESALSSFLWHGETYLNHEHKLSEHEQKQDNAIRAVIADIEIGAINKNKLQLISKDGMQVGRNTYWKIKCRICGDEKHCLPSSFLAEPCENLCDYLKRINNK